MKLLNWLRRKLFKSRPRYTLDALLDDVTPDNLHGEIDFGAPMGKEMW